MQTELQSLLLHRLAVIHDHEWRDRDPAGHLEALRLASEALTDWTAKHRTEIDPQLRHFLANASYQKALAHIADLPP